MKFQEYDLAREMRHSKSVRRKPRESRTEMNKVNPTADDLFEKAREAFFGTVKTSRRPSASPTEFLKPRNEPSPKIVTGPSSDERDVA